MPSWQNLFLIIKGRTLKMGQSKLIGMLACLAILFLTMITGCGDDENHEPVANAGSDVNALVGETVTLDGSLSTDSDGDQIQYTWMFFSVPQDSNATLSNPFSATPTFIVDKEGDYVVNLVVFDGLESNQDSVTVTGIR
ncbi:MAG: domain containing protein [Geobacteraceae bacterium]|nr:domain containing protein [Geobacteraceae bacterium]